ncbi:helix-turn-helix domain-containing protein [Streptomyces sp. V2I9]|uniref:helix-turn-helix domain-containing protein n=1 Tax=Streptomyces sp. V2I9 TaxID=3042304 RepID=UPI0027869DBF|nr:helix-turn-helix domain-containing protein [Streptomyces sp. V2I9]MDQ0986482.1 DNA-directed RNA polymerase specialized sigma24 family protein/DNA-binding transcriptional regulator YiaG [Streptomyces sp. V2I9]
MTRSTTDEGAAEPLPSPKERRRLRETKALSEEQVAAAVGVTRATVRSWETGRTSPRGRKRALYAKIIAPEPEPEPEPKPKPEPEPVKVAAPGTKAAVKTEAVKTAAPPKPVTGPVAEPPVAAPKRGVGRGAEPPPEAPKPVAGRVAAPGAVKAKATAPVTAAAPAEEAAGAGPAAAAQAEAGAEAEESAAPEPPDARDFAPADAFDELYARTAPGLVRQTYLLTRRRALARESVERAFQLAWHRWPEVAVDRDPAGWVRAAAYEYALSPWHRMRRAHRYTDAPPTEPVGRALSDALLDLPPAYRRTLLLYDGVGLDLPETAAETEASTPAAAGRLMTARAALAERLPELAGAGSPAEQSALLHDRLGGLARAEDVPVPRPADAVRAGGENRARLWTRAAVAGVALLMLVTGLTLHTAPTHYEQPIAPAERVGGVPPRGGPQQLTPQDLELQKSLREQMAHGPERLVPEPR